MEYKIQFESQQDRETIIAENSNKVLVEEQYLFEGNFLIFSDTPRPVTSIEKPVENSDLQELQKQILVVMDALATMYEDMILGGVTGG